MLCIHKKLQWKQFEHSKCSDCRCFSDKELSQSHAHWCWIWWKHFKNKFIINLSQQLIEHSDILVSMFEKCLTCLMSSLLQMIKSWVRCIEMTVFLEQRKHLYAKWNSSFKIKWLPGFVFYWLMNNCKLNPLNNFFFGTVKDASGCMHIVNTPFLNKEGFNFLIFNL